MSDETHPPEDALLDHARGVDGGGAAAGVERHLAAGCAPCSRRVARWRRAGAALAGEAAGDRTPEGTMRRAFGMLHDRGGPPPEPGPGDPAPDEGGLRIPSRIHDRELLFDLGGLDVEIRLRPGPGRGRATAVGRLRSTGSAPGRLRILLHGPDEAVTSLSVTEWGEFTAREIGPGEQTLEIVLDEGESHRVSFVV